VMQKRGFYIVFDHVAIKLISGRNESGKEATIAATVLVPNLAG
jgi:hypothetical protein